MDKILEGILQSDKPDGLKKQMCRKVEDLGRTTQPSATIADIFCTTTRIILNNPDVFATDTCKNVYLVWAKNHHSDLELYFTSAVLQDLLDKKVENQKEAMWVIHETMILIRSEKPSFQQLCKVIELKAISYVRQFPDFETVNSMCRFMFDFRCCIPSGGYKAMFCTSLISAAGTFSAPKTTVLMKSYIRDVTNVVGRLLEYMWLDADQTVIIKSLEQLFSLISYLNQDLNPSLALAGIVPHIPVKYVDSIVKQTVSDANIGDKNMKAALGRMINWLSWPGAKNLDTWIIAFFRGLAQVHKYSILMDVTEEHIEEVYQKLNFPVVRESAFEVLSHMLLSFQHSPEPFHKIVHHVPGTVDMLLDQRTEDSQRLASRIAQLLHCVMSHHLGFPDLYEPVLEAIKSLPKPTPEVIKQQLELSSWKSAQRKGVDIAAYTSWSKRSETGKTGLVNLGNTCYMNSVLQALFMCDSFRQNVLKMSPSAQQPLLVKLQYVFAFLSNTQRAAYAPSSFYEASRPPWFTAGHQQDCSEFMRYLYDQLHEQELAHVRSSQASSTSMEVDDSPAKTNISTLIQQMFSGKIATTYKCLSCQHESSHSEMFTDLPLAFPESVNGKVSSGRSARILNQKSALVGGASPKTSTNQKNGQNGKGEEPKEVVDLEELLHHYLKPEKLQGDNKYHCDMCRGLRDGERVIRVSTAPEYLNLTLLRFSYNVKARARSKIFTEVVYPKLLRLPVLTPKTSGAYTGTRGKVKKSKSDVIASHGHHENYALCAVIVHSGYSSDSGHYYCYARHGFLANQEQVTSAKSQSDKFHNPDADYLQDRWYLFNDSRVTYSSYESFSNVTKKFGKDTAYVLFYRRVHGAPVEGSSGDTSSAAAVTVDASEGARLDPPLGSHLRTAVDNDNKLYIKEQEVQERSRRVQPSSRAHGGGSQYYDWKDPDDDDGPPGSCGGGGGGSFSTNRLVF